MMVSVPQRRQSASPRANAGAESSNTNMLAWLFS
jgi:hypothetical protein